MQLVCGDEQVRGVIKSVWSNTFTVVLDISWLSRLFGSFQSYSSSVSLLLL